MRTITRTGLAAAAAATVLAVAGCGATEDDGDVSSVQVTPRATPSVGAGPEDSGTAPNYTVTEAPDPPLPEAIRDPAVHEAARAYIVEMENAASFYRASPRAWLDAVRPLMTDHGFKRWAESAGDRPTAAYRLAHERGWKVDVTVNCLTNPESGPQTDRFVGLRCVLVDVPVYADGRRVPVGDLDIAWPYNGVQRSYVLTIVNEGGRWLVGMDSTGLAG